VNAVEPFWLYWAGGLTSGCLSPDQPHRMAQLPGGRQSALARPVICCALHRAVGGAVLLLIKVRRCPRSSTRCGAATVFGFVVLLCCCPASTPLCSRARPSVRGASGCRRYSGTSQVLLIAIGLALIFSYVWGVRVAGLFTRLA